MSDIAQAEAPRIWAPRHPARPDGTIVITYSGRPYHVIADDPDAAPGAPPLAEALVAAEGMELPAEDVPEAPVLPLVLTRLQLELWLAIEWGASLDDLPALIDAIADEALPPAQKLEAKIILKGAREFHRENPLVDMVGAMLTPPRSPVEIDAAFAAARARWP